MKRIKFNWYYGSLGFLGLLGFLDKAFLVFFVFFLWGFIPMKQRKKGKK